MNDLKKIAKPAKKLPQMTPLNWFSTLKKNPLILGVSDSAQEILTELNHVPALDLQMKDVMKNLDLLQERPLTNLQTQRLKQKLDHNQDSILILEAFESFHHIWSTQIQLSDETQQCLYPHAKPYAQNNADTLRYKSYIEHVLFMLLCLQKCERSQIELHLLAFIQWMNRICIAATTAKISVREKPSINSQILIELPKHSSVTCLHDEDDHWKKITLSAHPEITGYVIGAYLKMQDI